MIPATPSTDNCHNTLSCCTAMKPAWLVHARYIMEAAELKREEQNTIGWFTINFSTAYVEGFVIEITDSEVSSGIVDRP